MQNYKGYTGQVLVASAQSNGTVFEGTEIYLLEHDLLHARGFVINQPQSGNTYWGGPVQTDLRFVLVKDALKPNSMDFIAMNEDDQNDPLVQNTLKLNNGLKVFEGYAGWGAFDLNREIMQGYWSVKNLDYDLFQE